jgi:hypothetical protein
MTSGGNNKMRLLLTLAVLAIGLAVPAIAQEQNTVDPDVRHRFLSGAYEVFYRTLERERPDLRIVEVYKFTPKTMEAD